MSYFSVTRVRKKEFSKGIGQSHLNVEQKSSLMEFFENRMSGMGQSQLNVEQKRTRRKDEPVEVGLHYVWFFRREKIQFVRGLLPPQVR